MCMYPHNFLQIVNVHNSFMHMMCSIRSKLAATVPTTSRVYSVDMRNRKRYKSSATNPSLPNTCGYSCKVIV